MENKISILILGSGAREHALARKLAQSPLTEKVLLAPGNGGTAIEFENITVDLSDFEDIARLILKHRTELVVIGPEQPLVDGLVDFLEERPEAFFRSVHLVGPGKACAALEGSKDFSKLIMEEAGIPTAAARTFFAEDWQELEKYLLPRNPPFVIKADGLASGKGVAICQSIQEALEFSAAILKDNVFAAAKPALLVEEFLTGIEISMFLLSDGLHYLMLPEAKDYKRILDGDLGPNTGGMGSVSPVWFADREFTAKVRSRIVDPLFKTLNKRGLNYKGFLFLGLMNKNGNPYVIEFNVRLGDPETQTLMLRIGSDLVPALLSLKDQTLHLQKLDISEKAVCTLVMAAENYPDSPVKGDEIRMDEMQDAEVFFAGTAMENGVLKTAGGRVLSLTCMGEDLKTAREMVYRNAEKIVFRGARYRKDIGLDMVQAP
jgi:phosphoribosylamine--glycine ligase